MIPVNILQSLPSKDFKYVMYKHREPQGKAVHYGKVACFQLKNQKSVNLASEGRLGQIGCEGKLKNGSHNFDGFNFLTYRKVASSRLSWLVARFENVQTVYEGEI